jgi:hypothetical protein
MATQTFTKHLVVSHLYKFCRPNSLTEQAIIKQFSDSDVVLKRIVGDKLVEEKVSLMDFWEWQPIHVGAI